MNLKTYAATITCIGLLAGACQASGRRFPAIDSGGGRPIGTQPEPGAKNRPP